MSKKYYLTPNCYIDENNHLLISIDPYIEAKIVGYRWLFIESLLRDPGNRVDIETILTDVYEAEHARTDSDIHDLKRAIKKSIAKKVGIDDSLDSIIESCDRGYRINVLRIEEEASGDSIDNLSVVALNANKNLSEISMIYAPPAPSLQTNPVDVRTGYLQSSLALTQDIAAYQMSCFVDPPLPNYKEDHGRTTAYDELRSQLKRRGCIFITGEAGIGKTEFVLHSLEKLKEEGYTSYQVNFKETLEDTILQLDFGLVDQPGAYQTPEDREYALRIRMDWLVKQSSKVILFIDNFDDPSGRTYDLLLEDGRYSRIYASLRRFEMHVIFTTKYKNFEDAIEIDCLPIELLTEVVAETSQKRQYSDAEVETIKKIVEEVECHSLTVGVIARVLARADFITPRMMLESLQAKRYADIKWPKVRANYHLDGREKTVLGHLMTVFDLSGLNTVQKCLLSYASLFPRSGISSGDFIENMQNAACIKNGASILDSINNSDMHARCADYPDPLLSNESFQEYLDNFNVLIENGWLFRKENKVTVHTLIQLVIKANHETAPNWKNCSDLLNGAICSSNLMLEKGDNNNDYVRQSIYLEIMENAVNEVFPFFTGTYEELLAHGPEILRSCQPYDGENLITLSHHEMHHEVFINLYVLAARLNALAFHPERAFMLFYIVSKVLHDMASNQFELIGYIYSRLAMLSREFRSYDVGVEFHKLAILTYSQQDSLWEELTAEHIRLGQLYMNYALSDEALEQFGIAKEIATQHGMNEADISQKFIGEGEGCGYMFGDDVHSIMRKQEEKLRKSIEVYGENSHFTGVAHSNLASVLIRAGEYESAYDHLQKALDIFGDDPERIKNRSICFINIAKCKIQSHEFDYAETYAWLAADYFVRAHLGDDPDSFHIDMRSLVEVLQEISFHKYPELKNNYYAASPSKQSALYNLFFIQIKAHVVGKADPQLLEDYYDLRVDLEEEGMHEEEKDCLMSILEIEQQVHGTNSREYLLAKDRLALLYAYTNEYKKAGDTWSEMRQILNHMLRNEDTVKPEEALWLYRLTANVYYNIGLVVSDMMQKYMNFDAARRYILKCLPYDDGMIEEAIDIYDELIRTLMNMLLRTGFYSKHEDESSKRMKERLMELKKERDQLRGD